MVTKKQIILLAVFTILSWNVATCKGQKLPYLDPEIEIGKKECNKFPELSGVWRNEKVAVCICLKDYPSLTFNCDYDYVVGSLQTIISIKKDEKQFFIEGGEGTETEEPTIYKMEFLDENLIKIWFLPNKILLLNKTTETEMPKQKKGENPYWK
ncbi:MAG: hypothetical protein L6Q54_10235 [Leptospiraceae bacterium]|nr:hypothetical protein [Leptospiraceae bacterium]MCK6381605.1 hypothetical protein [Leptospiraceae bacterium]NUM41481.1 hypothetical protein [Leptospiraceae bacterium]